MRKKRSDDKLTQLNAEQQTKLWDWMSTHGLSYMAIRNLVRTEFGVETSTRALSTWWEEKATEESTERNLRAVSVANNLGAQISENLPQITNALKAQLTQRAFEVVQSGGDPKLIEAFMSVVGGINKAELDKAKITIDVKKLEQRVREYEEKNAAAKAALSQVASKGGLTPETVREIEEAAKLL